MTRLATPLQRRRLSMFLAAALALTLSSAAFAAWSSHGSGAAGGAATTMPAGAVPTATLDQSLNGGPATSVTLTWPAATLPGGTPVAGYTITRFAQDGSPQSPNASCNGLLTATTCTEQNVPAGTWTYTDTPAEQNWTGAESPASNPVAVTAPPAPLNGAGLAPSGAGSTTSAATTASTTTTTTTTAETTTGDTTTSATTTSDTTTTPAGT